MGAFESLSQSVVALPLLLASLIATTLICERLWVWNRISKRQQKLVRAVLESYVQQPQAAIARLKKHTDLPIARIFLAAVTLTEATPEEFRLALESTAQGELPLLKRFSTAINTIVGIAPLLGLLGTILGLMRALASRDLGTGDSDRALNVVSGIGEALITTAIGLAIAILLNASVSFRARRRVWPCATTAISLANTIPIWVMGEDFFGGKSGALMGTSTIWAPKGRGQRRTLMREMVG